MDIEEYSKYKYFYAGEPPKLLCEYLKNTKWDNFMDLGCGDGFLLYNLNKANFFDKKNVYAVDLSKNRIDLAKNINKNFIYLVEDACNIKAIKDKSIDFLTSIQLIEHVEDDKALIEEMQRVLSRGGIAYVATIYKKWYGWYFYRCRGKWTIDPTHLREYTKDSQLLDIFKNCGFEVLENRKNLTWRPIIDFIFKRLGFDKNVFLRNPFLQKIRSFQVPVPGYYNWEILCRKI